MNQWIRKSISCVLAIGLLLPVAPLNSVYAADTMPDVSVPQFTPPPLSTEAPTKLLGNPKGVEALANANYFDAINNTYQRDIVKMSALGLIFKNGSTEFRPKTAITGNEAIAMLVRARGREAAVQTRVSAGSAGLNAAALRALRNTEYAREALALNIVPQAEQVDLDKPATREKLTVWAARTLNLQPDFNDLTGVYSFKDAESVSPQYRNLVETMVTEKLVTLGNDGNFKPKGTVPRGEFAANLNLMSDRFATNIAVTSDYGLVIGKKQTTETQAGVKLTKTIFTVKRVDGKLTELTVQYNPKTKVRNEFVSYKAEKLGDSKQIAIGDEVQYFVKNGQALYVEAINDNTLIDKMREAADAETGITAHFGAVGTITKQSRFENGKTIDTTKIRMKDFDGNVYEVSVETNPVSGVKNDVITYKNGKAGGTNLLSEGDNVTYYVKDNKTVVYIKATTFTTQNTAGTLRNIGTDEALKINVVSIYDYNERIKEYPIAQHALVTVNGAFAQMKDLQMGQDVKLTVRNGYVTKVETETFTEKPGAIPEYGKMRMGEVYMVYNNYMTVDLTDGSKARYNLGGNTLIIKDGVAVDVKGIKEGDKVKLYFSDIYSPDIQKVEIEGAERLIKQIYKGDIKEVNSSTQTVTIAFPAVMRNTGWIQTGDYTYEVPYSENTKIYNGSTAVTPNNFAKLYKDKTAYVVVEENYGQETAVKINIRSGGEILSKDSVQTVNATLNSMELYNKENFLFNEGTIVIKDGRLIDPSRIKNMDTAYVVGDYYMGKRTASVVRLVTGIESIFNNLYAGALYTVDYSSVTFKNYTKMTSNQWGNADESESRRFYYSTDTRITNLSANPVAVVKPQNFFHGGYSMEENRDSNSKGLKYERYYGIFVTDGADMIYALNLRKLGLISGQNIDDNTTDESTVKNYINSILKNTNLVRGTVTKVDTQWTRLQLTNSNEWSSSLVTWNANAVDTYVKYTDALIMKNNKVITVDDIKSGDTVYVMKYNEAGLVIFVEGY